MNLLPSLDYIDVLKVTRALTRNSADVERAFALMVFNVLAHIRADSRFGASPFHLADSQSPAHGFHMRFDLFVRFG